MSAPEPTSDPAAATAPAGAADSRLPELRAELEAREDKVAKAILADAIGQALLADPGQEAQAVRELLASYNHDPSFRPPLFALVDGFERKRSFKNLGRLYDAEQKSATEAGARADAQLDRAMLLLATSGSLDEVDALLSAAAGAPPERASTWAVVEAIARHRGRDDLAKQAARARAERARSARLRAVLLHEAAVESVDEQAALALLVEAASADPASERIQTALDGAARAARKVDLVVDALERRAGGEEEALLAAALFVEASALSRARLDDAARALRLSGEAVSRAPEDLLVWVERAEACEAAEAWAELDEACVRVLALAGESLGTFAAVVHHRRAEAASNLGRADEAASHLEAARAAAPGSRALEALSDRGEGSLLDARRAQLEARLAAEPTVATRVEALRELAGIAAALGRRDELDAHVEAFSAAAAEAGDAVAGAGDAWRDLALIALSTGAPAASRLVAAHVLDGVDTLPDAERSVWRLTALHLQAGVEPEHGIEARGALVRAALADPACAEWAPEVARVEGARIQDHALVAEAHAVLAERAPDPAVASAHRIARARSLVRAGSLEEAQAVLTKALEAAPGDAYGRALLEEIGKARGDVESVLRTLRETGGDATPAALAAQLSSAAHLGEVQGNAELARRSAEEALAVSADAVDARHLLARVALRAHDPALLASARAGLRAPVWRLLEGLAAQGEARAAALEPLRDEASVRLEAAFALASTPGVSAETRATALAALGPSFELPPDPLAGVRSGAAGAWLELADALADDAGEQAQSLAAQGLRVALLRGEMDDDSFLRVAELEGVEGEVHPDPALVSAEVILDAMLRGESNDTAELASAHGRHAARGAPADVAAAQARYAVAAGRGDEVVDALSALVEADPTDVASADALRVAAREARSWPDVVRACDLLAERAEGELRAQLLEEAAAVLMDEVDDVEGAEQRCRRALEVDRQRDIAYARLHDLLAERGDDAGLLDLVNARSEVFDDPEFLAPLLYEQARLFRGLGQVEEALASLDNLLLLEPEHIGGLALQVEIHVQRESFADAVDSLRALATAESAPASQRRIARLGAAEFLEKKLDDAAGALAELKAIESELGMADRVVFERMAALAEKTGRLEDAARAHSEAAARSNDPSRKSAAFRRLGDLARRQGRLEDAAQAYRQAIDAQPDDVDSAEALAEIPVAGDAEERVQAVSAALRAGSFPVAAEHVGKIERVARLAGDWGLSSAAQELLRAFEGAPTAPAQLDLARLRPAADAKLALALALPRDAYLELALLTCEALAEVEPQEPATFNAGRTEQRARGQDASADLVLAISSQLGAAGDVFVAGEGKSFVGGVAKGRPFYVLGKGARVPHILAYDAAFYATGIKAELAPLTFRCARNGASGVATAMLALAAAAGAPLPASESREGLGELAKSFSKVAAKRAKRAVPELLPALGEARQVAAWARDFQARLVRVATFASGDLVRGLGSLTGSNARPESVAASEAAAGLAREWLRSETIAARAVLGWRAPD
jgi:tetratricopeptide (TPR) repeat protein